MQLQKQARRKMQDNCTCVSVRWRQRRGRFGLALSLFQGRVVSSLRFMAELTGRKRLKGEGAGSEGRGGAGRGSIPFSPSPLEAQELPVAAHFRAAAAEARGPASLWGWALGLLLSASPPPSPLRPSIAAAAAFDSGVLLPQCCPAARHQARICHGGNTVAGQQASKRLLAPEGRPALSLAPAPGGPLLPLEFCLRAFLS